MITSKEEIIKSYGLKPCNKLYLEKILNKETFFLIDLRFGSEDEAAIYIVSKQARIEQEALILHGANWRYLIDIRNINYLIQDDVQTCLPYSFAEQSLESGRKTNLVILDRSASRKRGLNYYQKILQRYEKDLSDYLQMKQEDSLTLVPKTDPLL